MKTNIDIKSLNCPNCGAKLSVTRNTTDVVFCEACGTKCVITGLNVNEEILKKNNINSGIPLVEASSKIHQSIFEFITMSKNFPIDVLENLEIKAVRTVCVPAYLFTVSAFATYTYEAGNVRQQDNVATDRNGRVVTQHTNYTEWTQMSSIANDTRTVIVSGNSVYMNVINTLYGSLNPAKLVDIEFLDYPSGTVTEAFDVPYVSAFTSYVRPAIDKYINESALQSLQGKTYRNFAVGKANIQKEYEARVSLGIYVVDCVCKDQQFSMYFNADASNYLSTVNYPEDTARATYIGCLRKEKEQIKGTFVSDIFHGGFTKAKENQALQREEKEQIQQKIDSVIEEPVKAKEDFIKRKCRLKGVYSNGNDSFEWKTYNPEVPITTDPFVKHQNNLSVTQQPNYQESSFQQSVNGKIQQRSKKSIISLVALIFVVAALLLLGVRGLNFCLAVTALILSIVALATKRDDTIRSVIALLLALVAIFASNILNATGSRSKKSQPSEKTAVVTSESSQTSSSKITVSVEEITEKWEKDGIVDYPDVNVFEQAVNNGEDLVGKTVTFTVSGVRPDSVLGYNLYGGEHLNFVSDEGKGINEGDEITVIVTDVKRVLSDSYKVSYVLLDKKSKQDT